ncbi:Sulfur carrier protein ThiS adenylyltransferase [Anaerobiospirillum thomasii]|uniref:Sulfur carrier protein ThiS adenylyltransferase n=1 Tax=Anaerobiospirillum thomasii TaxID=179995 RepID=A0A2X0V275_9GAMM|nr:ThiF family adenylyltransferase [Anaerobiospirillum thomasii]SPT68013.1 Sulfur carrier protein ThiS adenylyltransferase [Anaerobiospirillum thomasii]SPT70478.1 Sulfur carrier protein ThiS adenylyltransferase [Anaerobiospirillum thomasii]
MRHSRQEMLDDFAKSTDLLKQKRVGIVGVGGLGGLCSLLLTGAGVGSLHISDSDEVSLSNLHRQILYREDDVGHSKTQSAMRELKALDKSTDIVCFEKITRDNFDSFARGCDLIMDLSDNMPTRLLLNELCLKQRIDFIHTSVGAYRGIMMGLLFSSQDFVDRYGCYQCMTGTVGNLELKGILGPAAAMMSSSCAMLALQMLNGNTDACGIMHLFDLKNFTVRKMELARDVNCTCCAG